MVAARRVGGEIIDVVMWCCYDGIAQNYPSSAANCSRRLHTHVDERAAAAVFVSDLARRNAAAKSPKKACVHAKALQKNSVQAA